MHLLWNPSQSDDSCNHYNAPIQRSYQSCGWLGVRIRIWFEHWSTFAEGYNIVTWFSAMPSSGVYAAAKIPQWLLTRSSQLDYTPQLTLNARKMDSTLNLRRKLRPWGLALALAYRQVWPYKASLARSPHEAQQLLISLRCWCTINQQVQ